MRHLSAGEWLGVHLLVGVAVLLWPLAIFIFVSGARKPEPAALPPGPEDAFHCQRVHLRMLTSPAQAEQLGEVTDPLGRAPALPFGHLHSGWRAFLGKQEAAYSLWYFEVPDGDAAGAQRLQYRGFAWVKARKVQAEFIFEWG